MKNFFLFFIFSFATLGCINAGVYYAKKNDSIPQQERNEIRPMVDSIYDCIINKNSIYVKGIADSYLLNNISFLDTISKNFDFIVDKKHDPYDQFFIKNSSNLNIKKVGSEAKGYDFYLNPIDGYTYIYLMPIFTKDGRSSWLIACIFNKSVNNWKLTSLYLNMHKYDGRSAIEFYNDAKDNYDDGKYLQSYYDMHIAYNLATAGGPGFHYLKEKEITDFAQKTQSTLNEKKLLPFTVSEIKTNPKITNVGTTFYHSKLFTTLNCESAINMGDTAAIKKEGYEISKYIENYIPDISKFTDSIIYQFVSAPANSIGLSSKYSFIAPSK